MADRADGGRKQGLAREVRVATRRARRAYRRGGAAGVLVAARRRAAQVLDPAPSGNGTNPLEAWFHGSDHRLVHKWLHYFDIYHRHLSRFRGKPVVIVEFGVFHGGSLQMWQHYFGPRARIFGIDIDPRCKDFAGPGVEILIGDQEDRTFLRSVAERTGRIDVVIEDGGHTMGQQIATFEEIYPRMSRDGVYLVEDLHTSYWRNYGGGYQRSGTFVEYAKSLTDQLNAFHSRQKDFAVNRFTRTTRSMHFYDSVIVFERGRVTKPGRQRTGRRSF